MDHLRKLALNNLEKTVLSMGNQQAVWRKHFIKQKDNMLGRDRVGVDKFGNKYYQYYSYHGLPTKRIVLYKFFDTNCFHQDPHFVGWLRRNEILPPTPEELERMYLEHDAFVQKGLDWDQDQVDMIEEFKIRKAELDEKYDREVLKVGLGPKSYVPGTKAEVVEPEYQEYDGAGEDENLSESSLAVMSELDMFEKTYMSEYEKVYLKDKEDNKDLNNLAIQELKRAQYFFAYMRSQEKEFNKERIKQEKEKEILEMTEEEKEQRIQKLNNENIDQKDQVLSALKDKDLGGGYGKNDLGKSRSFKPMKKEHLKTTKRYDKFREEFKDIFDEINEKKAL